MNVLYIIIFAMGFSCSSTSVECFHFNIVVQISGSIYRCFGTNITPQEGKDFIIIEGNDVDILRDGNEGRISYFDLIKKIKKMKNDDGIWVQYGNGADQKVWRKLVAPVPKNVKKEMLMEISYDELGIENQFDVFGSEGFRIAHIVETGLSWIAIGKPDFSTLEVFPISNFVSTVKKYECGTNCGIVKMSIAGNTLDNFGHNTPPVDQRLFLPKDPATPMPTTPEDIQTMMQGLQLERITAKNIILDGGILKFEAVFRPDRYVCVELSLLISGIKTATVASDGILSESGRTIYFYWRPKTTMEKKKTALKIDTWDEYVENQKSFTVNVTIQYPAKRNEKSWPVLNVTAKPLRTIQGTEDGTQITVGVLEYTSDIPFQF